MTSRLRLAPFRWNGKMSTGGEWETGGQNNLQGTFWSPAAW